MKPLLTVGGPTAEVSLPLDTDESRDARDGEPFTYLPNPGLGLWRI